MQEKSCIESDNEDSNFESKPPRVAFIVFWSSLLMLLQRCLHPTWVLPANIKRFSLKGCQLFVSLQCSNDHVSFCKSKLDCNRFSVGNLMSAVAVLFSANTYQRIASFFQLANIQWILKARCYEIQKTILVGRVKMKMKRRGNCCLSGAGRCDSPRHNAKYLTYSFMDKETGKVPD